MRPGVPMPGRLEESSSDEDDDETNALLAEMASEASSLSRWCKDVHGPKADGHGPGHDRPEVVSSGNGAPSGSGSYGGTHGGSAHSRNGVSGSNSDGATRSSSSRNLEVTGSWAHHAVPAAGPESISSSAAASEDACRKPGEPVSSDASVHGVAEVVGSHAQAALASLGAEAALASRVGTGVTDAIVQAGTQADRLAEVVDSSGGLRAVATEATKAPLRLMAWGVAFVVGITLLAILSTTFPRREGDTVVTRAAKMYEDLQPPMLGPLSTGRAKFRGPRGPGALDSRADASDDVVMDAGGGQSLLDSAAAAVAAGTVTSGHKVARLHGAGIPGTEKG